MSLNIHPKPPNIVDVDVLRRADKKLSHLSGGEVTTCLFEHWHRRKQRDRFPNITSMAVKRAELVDLLPKLLMDSTGTEMFHGKSILWFLPHVDGFTQNPSMFAPAPFLSGRTSSGAAEGRTILRLFSICAQSINSFVVILSRNKT